MAATLSTVILPHQRWNAGGRDCWTRAEALGFLTAYTYDHLSWRTFRDGPWLGAVPTLAAAAEVTSRIRLGTLVTSPNFRHPVTLAKELITLDDLSGGRIDLGIGSGGTGFDAVTLGEPVLTPPERAERFEEFVRLLDQLLTTNEVTASGAHYVAHEAQNLPGCVQRPRIPFTIAGNGPRGMALAARFGSAWVSTGDPALADGGTAAASDRALADQVRRLDDACLAAGRSPLRKVLLVGFTPEANQPLESVERFTDFVGRHEAIGFEELAIHWPIPDSVFAADHDVFEAIAASVGRR